MKLTALIALALLSISTAAPLGAADSRSREPLKLRLGLGSAPAPPLPNSVLWLARDLGFYQREGLDVELTEFQGTMRAIHSPDARLYFLLAARDEIKTVSALQGRTFAVSRIGSADHSLSMLALKSLGFNPAGLKLIAMGVPSARAQALAAGRVDATSLSVGTWVTIQKDPGVRVLVDQNTYYENATVVEKVNAVTTKVMEEKPDHLRRFTAAILKASRHFAENQDAWVAAVTKRRPDLDRKDAADLWAGFKTSWAVNGLMNLDAYKKTADFFYGSG